MIERAHGLATDLYELTMAAAYFDSGMDNRAMFELFVRSLPENRSYLVAAGLEQALDYLSTLEITGDQIDYLRHLAIFKHVSPRFFEYLREFRFTGDVWAISEGTAAFAPEPLLRVEAPIIEAQIVETSLLSHINFQTLIATKSARVTTAAKGRAVIEFGTRRAHGPEAGLLAARAAFVGGCIGTSNVEAGYLFGIPVFGTLAHSFVMLFDQEDDAFEAFLKVFPDTATILVDTYDTIAAVERLARGFGPGIAAVRLDSGDLLELSKRVRRILDEAGMSDTKIFASGDLDEYRISNLVSSGAPIDSFGVGTQLATSYDSPALGGVYKLVGKQEGDRLTMSMKLSAGKATYPGPKQVWRLTDSEGKYARDLISLADEPVPSTSPGSWKPLLEKVMTAGRFDDRRLHFGEIESSGDETVDRVRETVLAGLTTVRMRATEELKRLPLGLLDLDSSEVYPVDISPALAGMTEQLRNALSPKV